MIFNRGSKRPATESEDKKNSSGDCALSLPNSQPSRSDILKYDHSFRATSSIPLQANDTVNRPQCSLFIFAFILCSLLLNCGCILFMKQRYYLRPTISEDSAFSADSVGKARHILEKLTEKPHIVGTKENEIIIRAYLLSALVRFFINNCISLK